MPVRERNRGLWIVLAVSVALVAGGCASAGTDTSSAGQVASVGTSVPSGTADSENDWTVWPMPGGATLLTGTSRGTGSVWCDQSGCADFAGPNPDEPGTSYGVMGAASSSGPAVIDVSPVFLNDANDTVRMRVATLSCSPQSCRQTGGGSVVAPPAFTQFSQLRMIASTDGQHAVVAVDQEPDSGAADAQWAMICQDPRCGQVTVTPLNDPDLADNGIISANATGGFAIASLETSDEALGDKTIGIYACAQPSCPAPVKVGFPVPPPDDGQISPDHVALRTAGDDLDVALVVHDTIRLWTCAGCLTKAGSFTLTDTMTAPQQPAVAFDGDRLLAASADSTGKNVDVASCDPTVCGKPRWQRVVTTSDPVTSVAVGTALGQTPRVEWTTRDHTSSFGDDTLNSHVLACRTPTCTNG